MEYDKMAIFQYEATMKKTPHLAPLDENSSIILTRMPNGGWIAQQIDTGTSIGRMPTNLGAFGCSKDLVDALRDALK